MRLEAWQNVYVVLGTASASLIGLLFVAASLHLREIVNDAIYRTRAQYSMLLLAGTLVQATAVLLPQPLWTLGAELFVVNVWSISIPLGLLLRTGIAPPSGKRGGFSSRRAAFYIVCYLIALTGAVALIAQREWGLYLVTVGYLGGILAIIWNAWHIMLGIGQSARKRAH